MTEIIMAEIITKDELTLISIPASKDPRVIWNVLDKLCDKRTKVRIIYSKEGYGTKETVMLWPTSYSTIQSATTQSDDICSQIACGSKDFKLSSVPLLAFSNVFWCSSTREPDASIFSVVKMRKSKQSVLGLEIKFRKKRYMIGLLNQ